MNGATAGIVPILCYHAIGDDLPSDELPFAFSPSTFAQHLDAIDRLGLQTVRVTELVAAREAGDHERLRRSVAITFDDGYADLHDVVLPELQKRSMVATAFVTTSYVDGRSEGRAGYERWASWEQVGVLAESGAFEIGTHSHDHLELDMIGLDAACEQAQRCRDRLRAETGVEATSFAYPYGYTTSELSAALGSLGYRAACVVKHALSSAADDPFELARVRVLRRHDVDTVRAWIEGRNLRTSPCPTELRTRAYRVVRRVRHAISR